MYWQILIAIILGILFGFFLKEQIAYVVGIGATGIPLESLVMTVMIIPSVGLPAESMGVILQVDHFFDMDGTSLNVYGDAVCAVLITKAEQKTYKYTLLGIA